MRLAILILVLAGGLVAWQEPSGSDTCNNFKGNAHPCACGRAMMCGMNGHGSGDPDAQLTGPNRCQKSCRKDLCKCLGPCTSRH